MHGNQRGDDPGLNVANDGGARLAVTFEHRGDRLIGLGLINGVLNLLTLGLYASWAKTEVRRKLWSFTRINGEPLAYTGTGRELFLGFLIVFFLVLLPIIVCGVAVGLIFAGNPTALTAYQGAIYVLVFLLIGNAKYRAQRYRLSRTQWRGIRGALVGSPGQYGWTYFWTVALPVVVVAGVALGVALAVNQSAGFITLVAGLIAALWVLPWRANKLQRMMTVDTRLGDLALRYDGSSGPLYRRYFFAWTGSALTIIAGIAAVLYVVISSGSYQQWVVDRSPPRPQEIAILIAIGLSTLVICAIITAWYRASQVRHFAHHTKLDNAAFHSSVSGRGLAWLFVSNWLLAVLGVVIGLAISGFLLWFIGMTPGLPTEPVTLPIASALQGFVVLAPIFIMTTAMSTFAHFRTTRYYVSNLALEGTVNLNAILQSQVAGPKRGEGLAQVFELDAF